MTRSPDDQIDPYESRLTRRVDDFAEQAVQPFDAAAIAAAAHAGARRRTLAGRLFGSSAAMSRLGVVFAGALVAVAAFGVYLNAGGTVSPSQSPGAPDATPTDVASPGDVACSAAQLSGEIVGWDGAAGHRIATVNLRNTGPNDCELPQLLRPALVDSKGHALIVGAPVTERMWITFGVGNAASTEVDMANYCGTAPTGDLQLRFYLQDQSSFETTTKLDMPGAIDPPPCNGPNAPGSIEMQPVNP
jgi:hypothetical protein